MLQLLAKYEAEKLAMLTSCGAQCVWSVRNPYVGNFEANTSEIAKVHTEMNGLPVDLHTCTELCGNKVLRQETGFNNIFPYWIFLNSLSGGIKMFCFYFTQRRHKTNLDCDKFNFMVITDTNHWDSEDKYWNKGLVVPPVNMTFHLFYWLCSISNKGSVSRGA